MFKNKLINDLLATAQESAGTGLGPLMECLLNELMQLEKREHLRAEPYERTETRQDYANGYKERTFDSCCGKLELQIPQVRNGNFYPGCLEKGLRSDRALKSVLAEMYIQGVSTRESRGGYEGSVWSRGKLYPGLKGDSPTRW